ncbi:hypothetical protein ACFLZU_06330 [Thermodesulfobacteriota bacterium]
MKRFFVCCCFVLMGSLHLANISFAAGVPVTHQFLPNTPAKAGEVNANFQELSNRIEEISSILKIVNMDDYFSPSNINKVFLTGRYDPVSEGTFGVSVQFSPDRTHKTVIETFTNNEGMETEEQSKYIHNYSKEADGYVWTDYIKELYSPNLAEGSYPEPDGKSIYSIQKPILIRATGVGYIGKTWGGESPFYTQELLPTRTGLTYSQHQSREYILSGIEDVTTPAGTFTDCLKITRIRSVLPAGSSSTDMQTTVRHFYYAKNIGKVKFEWERGYELLQSYTYVE